MKKKIAIVLVLLMAVAFISGCVSQTGDNNQINTGEKPNLDPSDFDISQPDGEDTNLGGSPTGP